MYITTLELVFKIAERGGRSMSIEAKLGYGIGRWSINCDNISKQREFSRLISDIRNEIEKLKKLKLHCSLAIKIC